MKLRVRELREERGWNQTVLGYHAGLSPSQISLIENGKRNPSAETLQGIATAFGVEVGDLFPKAAAPPSPEPERGPEEERRFSYWAGGIEEDVRRWEEWIEAVRQSADVPGTDPRTWARTVGMAALQRCDAAEAQGAVEAMKADGGRTPEGKRLRAALEALLAIPQKAADASVEARHVSAVLAEVEGKAPETLALEKRATLAP